MADVKPMAGHCGRSILRRVLLPLVALLICGLIFGLHFIGRQRELKHVTAFHEESARREMVHYDLFDAVSKAERFRSPAFFKKFFGPFGVVTSDPIPAAHRGWHVHIHNDTFGDVIDAKIVDGESSAVVQFSKAITLHTLSWQICTAVAWWIAFLISVLLLGGILGFLLPRSLRRWAVAVAMVAVTASLISTDETIAARFNVWSIAPAASLLLCCIALIWPERKSDPIKCRKCGYDLTGNESGVCPECGTPRRLHNLESLASNLDNIAEGLQE